MEIKIKLFENGVAPEFCSDGAAGMDLRARQIEYLDEYRVKAYLGVGFEIPEGYVGLLFPKSSISNKTLRLANCVGVIDSDYRGEVSAVFDIITHEDLYKVGEKCVQMLIVPVSRPTLKVVDELSKTERGKGGYGSTGRF